MIFYFNMSQLRLDNEMDHVLHGDTYQLHFVTLVRFAMS